MSEHTHTVVPRTMSFIFYKDKLLSLDIKIS